MLGGESCGFLQCPSPVTANEGDALALSCHQNRSAASWISCTLTNQLEMVFHSHVWMDHTRAHSTEAHGKADDRSTSPHFYSVACHNAKGIVAGDSVVAGGKRLRLPLKRDSVVSCGWSINTISITCHDHPNEATGERPHVLPDEAVKASKSGVDRCRSRDESTHVASQFPTVALLLVDKASGEKHLLVLRPCVLPRRQTFQMSYHGDVYRVSEAAHIVALKPDGGIVFVLPHRFSIHATGALPSTPHFHLDSDDRPVEYGSFASFYPSHTVPTLQPLWLASEAGVGRRRRGRKSYCFVWGLCRAAPFRALDPLIAVGGGVELVLLNRRGKVCVFVLDEVRSNHAGRAVWLLQSHHRISCHESSVVRADTAVRGSLMKETACTPLRLTFSDRWPISLAYGCPTKEATRMCDAPREVVDGAAPPTSTAVVVLSTSWNGYVWLCHDVSVRRSFTVVAVDSCSTPGVRPPTLVVALPPRAIVHDTCFVTSGASFSGFLLVGTVESGSPLHQLCYPERPTPGEYALCERDGMRFWFIPLGDTVCEPVRLERFADSHPTHTPFVQDASVLRFAAVSSTRDESGSPVVYVAVRSSTVANRVLTFMLSLPSHTAWVRQTLCCHARSMTGGGGEVSRLVRSVVALGVLSSLGETCRFPCWPSEGEANSVVPHDSQLVTALKPSSSTWLEAQLHEHYSRRGPCEVAASGGTEGCSPLIEGLAHCLRDAFVLAASLSVEEVTSTLSLLIACCAALCEGFYAGFSGAALFDSASDGSRHRWMLHRSINALREVIEILALHGSATAIAVCLAHLIPVLHGQRGPLDSNVDMPRGATLWRTLLCPLFDDGYAAVQRFPSLAAALLPHCSASLQQMVRVAQGSVCGAIKIPSAGTGLLGDNESGLTRDVMTCIEQGMPVTTSEVERAAEDRFYRSGPLQAAEVLRRAMHYPAVADGVQQLLTQYDAVSRRLPPTPGW